MKKDNKNLTKKISQIVVAILVVIGVYFLGYFRGHQDLIFEKGYIPKILNKEQGKPKDLDFSLFWDVWNRIEEKYPGQLDRQKMIYGAIQGLVEGVGDPYSVFMDPTLNKEFLSEIEGSFEGIGAEVSIKNGKLTIVAPLENSPSAKAGIKAGDLVLKIDGVDTEGMGIDEAITKIRGSKGSKVTLTIQRDNEAPRDIEMIRETIEVKSVKYEIKDNIAIIEVSQFGGDTVDLMNQAADDINNKNVKGIVLDLRNNPGGYLDSAVDVASFFIKDGLVVSEEYKDGKRDEFKANGNAKLAGKPLVVLINEGSASAAEIVAGAIQDHKVGRIIGKNSFGKGSVQDLEEFGDGSGLRLTVAKWLTPSGRYINSEGIKTDIEVSITSQDEAAGRDPQLERAIKELK